MPGYVYQGSARNDLVSLAQLPGGPRIVVASAEPLRPGTRPQYSRKKREQIARVIDGLTLACINLGLESVPNDPKFLERALAAAWRCWPSRTHFDSIQHSTQPAEELLMDALTRSSQRSTSLSFWQLDGRRLSPRLRPGVDLDARLHDLGPVRVEAWEALALTLARNFGPMANLERTLRSA